MRVVAARASRRRSRDAARRELLDALEEASARWPRPAREALRFARERPVLSAGLAAAAVGSAVTAVTAVAGAVVGVVLPAVAFTAFAAASAAAFGVFALSALVPLVAVSALTAAGAVSATLAPLVLAGGTAAAVYFAATTAGRLQRQSEEDAYVARPPDADELREEREKLEFDRKLGVDADEPARRWSRARARAWLAEQDLEPGVAQQLDDAFVAHDVDGQTLLELDDAIVREELGVASLGARRALLRCVDALRRRS